MFSTTLRNTLLVSLCATALFACENEQKSKRTVASVEPTSQDCTNSTGTFATSDCNNEVTTQPVSPTPNTGSGNSEIQHVADGLQLYNYTRCLAAAAAGQQVQVQAVLPGSFDICTLGAMAGATCTKKDKLCSVLDANAIAQTANQQFNPLNYTFLICADRDPCAGVP